MSEDICIQENLIKFIKESFAGKYCEFFILGVLWLSFCLLKDMHRHSYAN